MGEAAELQQYLVQLIEQHSETSVKKFIVHGGRQYLTEYQEMLTNKIKISGMAMYTLYTILIFNFRGSCTKGAWYKYVNEKGQTQWLIFFR